jgi:hypothetical protein
MLEDSQVAPNGKSILEDLAKKGFKKDSEFEDLHIYSDGKKNVWYNTKTESIVCTSVVYPKYKQIE